MVSPCGAAAPSAGEWEEPEAHAADLQRRRGSCGGAGWEEEAEEKAVGCEISQSEWVVVGTRYCRHAAEECCAQRAAERTIGLLVGVDGGRGGHSGVPLLVGSLRQ